MILFTAYDLLSNIKDSRRATLSMEGGFLAGTTLWPLPERARAGLRAASHGLYVELHGLRVSSEMTKAGWIL